MKNRLLAILLLLNFVSLTSPSLADVTPALTEWSVPPGQDPSGIEVIGDAVWYVSSSAIGTLDPTTNTFTGWPISSVATQPGSLKMLGSEIYFTDLAGSLICVLELGTDKIASTLIPTDDGGPLDLCLFPSGSPTYLLFTELKAGKIGRLDLASAQYSFLDDPRSSVTSTATFNNVVPEINIVTPTITPGNPNIPPPLAPAPPTISGVFTEWSVPPFMIEAQKGPVMIASDDTSYWFTTSKNYLGRLVNDNSIYAFTLPTASACTIDLKLDSLGNVWYTAGPLFVLNSPDIIGKLELSTGTITEWTIPTTGGAPNCLTIDGSGMVWFTETKGNKIGRLDPSTNTFHEFPVPNSLPIDIGVDSHGTVWFTEIGARKIGALSIAGQMVPEFPVNIIVLMAGTSVVVIFTYATRKSSLQSTLCRIT